VPDAAVASAFRIEIDGQPLDSSMESSVVHVVVDDHLHLPDTFVITLQESPEMNAAEQVRVKVGSKVKISATALGDASPAPLVSGEVTSLEGEYRESKAPVLLVRGYDASHRLMRGRISKVYRQEKYSDIAGEIADGTGLERGQIDDSGAVHEFVHQAAQTHWDFMRGLAREIGFEVAVRDGKLDFRTPPEAGAAPDAGDLASTNPLQLVFGQELLEFRPRVTAGGQVGQVTVKGWDIGAKRDLTGQEPAATTGAELPDSPASLAATFGSPGHVTGDRPRHTQEEVDAGAKALAEEIGSVFAEAAGIARGNPLIKAGAAVNVSLVANPFAGRYTLTHTRHVYETRTGYRTHFEISGRQERSLLGLASGGGEGATGSGVATPGLGGVQVGIVTENADPQNLGRVRVRLPYAGVDFVSDWARVAAPGNGPSRGFVWIPEVNDEVLVAFHHGSVREPYVLGGLWNGVDAPPPIDLNSGKLEARAFVSRTGQKIEMSDKSGSEGILISSADGSILVQVDAANKKVVVTADGGGKVEMKAQGDITIDAQGSVKISGVGGVEISSPASTKVSGTGQLSLESGGTTSVKGSMVSLG
jgi:phage protein D